MKWMAQDSTVERGPSGPLTPGPSPCLWGLPALTCEIFQEVWESDSSKYLTDNSYDKNYGAGIVHNEGAGSDVVVDFRWLRPCLLIWGSRGAPWGELGGGW